MADLKATPPDLNEKYKYRADANVTNYSLHTYSAIVPVKPDGTIDLSTTYGSTGGIGPGKFLINPSSWEENKSAIWVNSNNPGQSDPILQWLYSGPRTVSFTALVTKDTAYFQRESDAIDDKKPTNNGLNNLYSNIAGSFFQVNLPTPLVGNLSIQNTSAVPGYLDISNYLEYYRSLLYPTYDPTSTNLLYSPPLVCLFVGQSLSRIENGKKISTNKDVWVVTNLKINITKQLPNLAPMEAEVEFQLTQYNIKSYSRDRFVQSSLIDTGSKFV
jgi:hypothetical protein